MKIERQTERILRLLVCYGLKQIGWSSNIRVDGEFRIHAVTTLVSLPSFLSIRVCSSSARKNVGCT